MLRKWVERIQENRAKESLASQFSSRADKRLASQYLGTWAKHLARRKKLERRAQRAFEATVKAKALIQWRGALWAHVKQAKQAKLARRLFLTRMAWRRWREVVEERRREKRRLEVDRKVMKRVLDTWVERTRVQKMLKRKGDVVKMANETVSNHLRVSSSTAC